jgi:cytokinin dehydrogenase
MPGSKALAFMTELAARLTPDELGLGIALCYPIDTRQVSVRLFRLPTEPIAFYLGLLRFDVAILFRTHGDKDHTPPMRCVR